MTNTLITLEETIAYLETIKIIVNVYDGNSFIITPIYILKYDKCILFNFIFDKYFYIPNGIDRRVYQSSQELVDAANEIKRTIYMKAFL